MFSFKSIKNFFTFNSILSSLSLFHYYFTSYYEYQFLYVFSSHLIRNYLLIDLIDYTTKNNRFILEDNRVILKNKESFEFDRYVISTTLIETITFLFIKNYFFNNNTDINLVSDFIYFIPISFMYELIFDFFHYSTHLFMHKHPYFYINFHKVHHKYKYPTTITTFYQHPVDVIISNSIPTVITLCLIPVKPTYFQFILISTYKVFIEISGHLGKEIKSTSFTQCMWIPKLLDIELKVEHHDLHHTVNNCNYGKRFSLWDKVFNTFKDD